MLRTGGVWALALIESQIGQQGPRIQTSHPSSELVPRLIHGDCFKQLSKIEPSTVRMVLIDPPYGSTYLDWDHEFRFERLWPELWRVLVPDGQVIAFGSQPFTTRLIASQPERYRYSWTWIKEHPTMFFRANTQPLRITEDINVFGSGTGTYNPQMTPLDEPRRVNAVARTSKLYKMDFQLKSEAKTITEMYPMNLLDFHRDPKSMATQKPVALLRYLIRTYSAPGEVVLDPTMGSGSAGAAALQEGRAFIGIEKDRERFRIARLKIQNANP